jgi:hypothetical protein
VIEGWETRVEMFDFGSKWGVAVWNGKDGADRRHYGVRIPAAETSREQAIEAALPLLRQWITEAA